MAWNTLMVTSMAEAIRELLTRLDDSPRNIAAFAFSSFVVFSLTFFRFRVGDRAYHSRRKVHAHTSSAGNSGGVLRITGEGLSGDLLVMVFQALVFILLANWIGRPVKFVYLYAFLLLVNSIWLWLNLRQEVVHEVRRTGDLVEKRIACLEVHRASRCWIANNLVAFCILGVLCFSDRILGPEVVTWASIGVCFINCVLDLLMTRHCLFVGARALLSHGAAWHG